MNLRADSNIGSGGNDEKCLHTRIITRFLCIVDNTRMIFEHVGYVLHVSMNKKSNYHLRGSYVIAIVEHFLDIVDQVLCSSLIVRCLLCQSNMVVFIINIDFLLVWDALLLSPLAWTLPLAWTFLLNLPLPLILRLLRLLQTLYGLGLSILDFGLSTVRLRLFLVLGRFLAG